MAIADLFERLGSASSAPDDADPDPADIPDDASELMDDDVLPADPKPSRKKSPGRVRTAPGRVTAAQKKALRDQILLMIELPAGAWSLRDPVCGNAVLDQADAVADRLVPLICRNPAMLAWFLGSGAPYMDWIGLVMALRPIGTTIWAHHVSHSIGHEQEDQGAQDYSAYAAPAFSG